jgi:hypothetical protein
VLMRRTSVLCRAGYSVLEMLVTLVVGGIVIGGVGAIGFRQQRFQRDVVTVVERLEQLEQATALVPISVRGISPGEGDISAGAARDTSLEFRATIATAVVCDSGHGSVVLAPTGTDAPHLASVLTRPDAGDTAWVLAVSGAVESWQPHPITGVVDSTTTCNVAGVPPWADHALRRSITLRLSAPLGLRSGGVVRITRPWRYSIYKSSDGGWYLGARDWNASTTRFNTIQPVSGPFRSAAGRGLTLGYSDSSGATIPSGAADTHAIALVQVAFRVDSVLSGRYTHAIGIISQSVASFALRNRAH